MDLGFGRGREDTTGAITSGSNAAYGGVFYQAGIVALTASLWDQHSTGHGPDGVPSGIIPGGPGTAGSSWNGVVDFASGAATATGSDAGTGPARNIYECLVSSSISGTCDAIRHRIYNISFNNEKQNIEVVTKVLEIMGKNFNNSVEFVEDRPGHDFRYSVSPLEIKKLGVDMKFDFDRNLRETVNWYLESKR